MTDLLLAPPPWARGGVSPYAPDSPLADGEDCVITLHDGAVFVGRVENLCLLFLLLHRWGTDIPTHISLSRIACVRRPGAHTEAEARDVHERQAGGRPLAFPDCH